MSQLISTRLVQLRKEKNLTQQQLTDILNISRNTYAQYETGRREPDFNTALIFAKFFGVTIDNLLGNNIESPNLSQKQPTDLIRFLDESEVLFDGVLLTKEDKAKIKAALEIIFWDTKQEKKRKKS
ncbi:helix-turn-helix transcriptional regulator [Pelosinus baikalensis]|uniref:Helix-turn-helix domain-containing protein n=1 Tax=Pelosinus baikalensis TaxID=2892015 RepID=A0ABS8HUE7_9FIRM|nr:helix-turn-helix domain-containing protein [Pelosinus baikalensis]